MYRLYKKLAICRRILFGDNFIGIIERGGDIYEAVVIDTTMYHAIGINRVLKHLAEEQERHIRDRSADMGKIREFEKTVQEIDAELERSNA